CSSPWIAVRHEPLDGLLVFFPMIGIVVGYVVLAIWVNHTRIDLLSNTLNIKRGPLPWRRRFVAIAASTIQQLFVQRYVSHEENDQPATAFRVMARLKNGRDILIDRGMSAYAVGRASEQVIEKQLQIVDELVG